MFQNIKLKTMSKDNLDKILKNSENNFEERAYIPQDFLQFWYINFQKKIMPDFRKKCEDIPVSIFKRDLFAIMI